MEIEKIKVLVRKLYLETVSVMKDLSFFVRQLLGKKKIVIISDKGISSLPVSFRVQASISVAAMLFMLWVSYSTGKYFAYETIISEKDREIWTTHVTNENLQYQVSDLHDNLKELNKYFDNIRKLDQLAQKDVFDGDEKDKKKSLKVSSAEEKQKEEDKQEVRGILSNIRSKVLERISSLENVVEITGLNVKQVAASNVKLREVLSGRNEEFEDEAENHQGGAYIPVNDGGLTKAGFDKDVEYLLQLENLINSLPLSSPMQRYWLSSGFGKRVDPIKKKMAMHAGLDLVGSFKSKIYSSAPGVVKRAGHYGAYGRFVEIEHGSGITTRYAHLNKVLVKRGQEVQRGDLIGLQGNSGRSTGTHLHYEVRYNGKALDPKNFLTAGKYVF